MNKNAKQKQKTNLLCKFVFVISTFFIWASFVNAQIIITEIMYDPEGSDANSGSEWIEVKNTGNVSVDFSQYLFFENDTNHKISTEGDINIPAGDYAVLSKDPSLFESYFGLSNLIFKASFSLNNGELIAIKENKDDLVNTENSVEYSSDWGAKNDGNSLQLVNGNWVASTPTPGLPNVLENQNNQINQTQTTTEDFGLNEVGVKNEVLSDFPTTPKIFADAGKDRKIIVGADTMFNASAVGVEKKPLENARYSWSFGDGGLVEGQKVLYAYKYPSKYVVVLNVSSGEYTASDRIVVEALPADIVITEVNQTEGFIELYNRSGYELDLSWWRIRSGNDYFSFPKDTIILQDNKIRLFNIVTKFNYLDLNNIYLLYPNGEVVNKYNLFVTPSVRLHERSEVIQEVTKTQNTNYKNQTSSKTQNALQTFSTEKVYDDPLNLKQELDSLDVEEKDNQLAFVSGINKDNNNLFNKWTFSLLGLVLISVVGVLFMKGLELEETPDGENNEDLKPEDFEIITDK